MGFASLRFRASTATRWKIRLFLFPCNDRRRRTGIVEPTPGKLETLPRPCHVTARHYSGQFYHRFFNKNPDHLTNIDIDRRFHDGDEVTRETAPKLSLSVSLSGTPQCTIQGQLGREVQHPTSQQPSNVVSPPPGVMCKPTGLCLFWPIAPRHQLKKGRKDRERWLGCQQS